MCIAYGLWSIQRNFSRKVSDGSVLLPGCIPYSCHFHLQSHLLFERTEFMHALWDLMLQCYVSGSWHLKVPWSLKQEIAKPVTVSHSKISEASETPLWGPEFLHIFLVTEDAVIWIVSLFSTITHVHTWISVVITKALSNICVIYLM